MIEFLKTQFWFSLSNKLKLSLKDTKTVLEQIYELQESATKSKTKFDLSTYDQITIDAYLFYLVGKDYLNI